MNTIGYAVAWNGSIDVRTVSPTPLGAKVNWLIVSVGLVATNLASDHVIDRAFEVHRVAQNARLIKVMILEEDQ